MTPAALFAAVALGLPPAPSQLIDADAMVRCPEWPVQVTGRDRAALLAVGRRLELIGPGDVYAPCCEEVGPAEPVDAETLLQLLRDWHAELHDAPPLAAAGRLPPAAVCWAAASANGVTGRRFRGRALWEPDREAVLSAAAAECEAYRDFWFAAGCAAAGGEVADRRRSLALLRDMIGRDAWAAGLLPEFVPGHLYHAR